MIKQEYIICSAILRKVPLKKGKDIYKCELGYRHNDIIAKFKDILSEDPNAQGFFTNKGRFVNRIEAAIIAIKAKQVDNSTNIHELYSEDLY